MVSSEQKEFTEDWNFKLNKKFNLTDKELSELIESIRWLVKGYIY